MPVANIATTYSSRTAVLAAQESAHQERLRRRRVRASALRQLRRETGNPYAVLPANWTEPTVPDLRAAPVAPARPRVLTARDTQMGGYHNNSRDRQVSGDRRELYGLEMEVQGSGSDERNRAVAIANTEESTHFVDAERDGSLDSYSGVEFITRRPMTAADLMEPGGWLDRFTTRITSAGIRRGRQPSGYGIHINVNCHGWSPFAKQAFCAAVNLGHTYHVPIAGRSTGGGTYGATSFSVNTRNSSAFFTGWTQRGNLAYVRSNNPDCIEVRSFQGTTDPTTIRSYIAHLQELRTFSQRYQTILLYMAVGTNSGYFSNAEAFAYVDWLRTNAPSYSEAIARLPDTVSPLANGTTRRTHNQYYSASTALLGVINVIFNPATPFRLRKETLRGAWNTTEQAFDDEFDDSDGDDYAEDEDEDGDEW